jgi:hypothetical protein
MENISLQNFRVVVAGVVGQEVLKNGKDFQWPVSLIEQGGFGKAQQIAGFFCAQGAKKPD